MENILVANKLCVLQQLIKYLEVKDIGLYLDFPSPMLLMELSINNYLFILRELIKRIFKVILNSIFNFIKASN